MQGTGNNTGTITAQAIEEETPVTTPTSDPTPDYTFASTMAGLITYGGTCSSDYTYATIGSNSITFNTLSSGNYSGCTITVTDSSGNASNTLEITPFTVHIIDTTLLAHYAFEGNLNDNSSYSRNLTEDTNSNITYSAADNQSNKSGRAALFNGTNTFASVGNFTLGDNFTVAFWTFPYSSDMSQWDSAFSTGDNTNDGRFQIDFNDDNIRFCAGSCYISTTLNSGAWNHIVITKTDSTDTIQMFTDGLPCSGCSASSITTLWDKIKIGLNRSGGGYWNGYIDELKIYNRTFSSQEVRDLHDSY